MQPVIFPQANVVYAKDQPEYLPLPVARTISGIVTSCWKMTLWERLQALWTGKVYVNQLTFNTPLQPLVVETCYTDRTDDSV